MTRPDFPDKWHDLLSGYALGNLTSNEQAELEQLLRAQPELRAELHAYEATLAQLPHALGEQVPPPTLEDSILRRMHASDSTVPLESPASTNRSRRRPLWMAGSMIAAGLLLFLGWDNYQLRRSLTTKEQKLVEAKSVIQQLEQKQQETATVLASLQNPDAVYALQGTGRLAKTSGSVVTVAEENKAILVAHDLPSLPDSQVYRFWAATETENALIYCGQFTVNGDAPTEWPLPESACGLQASQVVVTVDPIDASTDSGGEIVMLSRSIADADTD